MEDKNEIEIDNVKYLKESKNWEIVISLRNMNREQAEEYQKEIADRLGGTPAYFPEVRLKNIR